MANKLEPRQKADKVQPAREVQKTKAQCSHHWIIEIAQGPTSKGVCKYCGEEKEFLNSWQDSLWEGDIPGLLNLPDAPDTQPEREVDS